MADRKCAGAPRSGAVTPALLSRTPYSNNDSGYVEQGKFYASRGYVAVIQDVRGKYDSEGVYALFRDEADVRQVIKLRAIYELLEGVTDRCEDVANIIEGIVLENA